MLIDKEKQNHSSRAPHRTDLPSHSLHWCNWNVDFCFNITISLFDSLTKVWHATTIPDVWKSNLGDIQRDVFLGYTVPFSYMGGNGMAVVEMFFILCTISPLAEIQHLGETFAEVQMFMR